MGLPDGQVAAADPGAGQAVPAGLLAKLMSTVRPEFRPDVLILDPAGLPFGCPLSLVAGCGRPGRARGLCHATTAGDAMGGKPDIAEFTAATDARLRGRSLLLPCRVAGCGYGRRAVACVRATTGRGAKAHQPAAEKWLSQQPSASVGPPPPAACRIGFFTLWA